MTDTPMHITAAPVQQGGDPRAERRMLELVVRLDQHGGPDPTPRDASPFCRMLSNDREEWSGTLEADGGRWVVHSSLGDDEPIRVLHMQRLRPGDHLTLCNPDSEPLSFRVEQVMPAGPEVTAYRRTPRPGE